MGDLSTKMFMNRPLETLRSQQPSSKTFMQKDLKIFATYPALELVNNPTLKKSAWHDLKNCKSYLNTI